MAQENNKNEKKPEYVSYKKVLLFGSKSTGKTSFSNLLKTGKFEENIKHTEESKVIY